MTHKKVPAYLTDEQRQIMMEISTDLDDRDLARYYTLTPEELELVNRRRRPANRFGFAVQLALLHFPGRPLAEYSNQRQVPRPILTSIAGQIHLPISAFAEYGNRPGTLYEHIDEICKECGYRRCGWREYLAATRFLLPHALESDRAVPLIEQAFEFFRKERILPPTLVQTEKLIWIVLRVAEDHLYTVLTARLTSEQNQRLDALLQNETRLGGHTRLAWLRTTTGDPSPKSINKIVERLLFIRELDLPSVPTTLHQNRVLHLARKCSKLSAQPLLKITSRKRRYSLLLTYLHELSQDLTDLALDQFDKLLADLFRKGKRKQDKHIRVNARKINAHLTVLTRAAEAFLQSCEEGSDIKEAVLARVPATVLQQTVTSAKALLRPEDFDSLDLIETRYVPMRKSLFTLYQALDFQPGPSGAPAIQALDHATRLQKSRKRVTGVEQRVGRQTVTTPLAHLTDRWKKHVILGDEIAPNQYEAAAFEALNARLHSGDVAVGGSRRHQPFEDYLLPKQEFAQLVEKKQTRLAVQGTAEYYLEQKQHEIVEKLSRLRKSIGVVDGALRLDEHGKLQLPPLEKAVPEQAEYHSRRMSAFLPRIPLADLLLEVDNWTGFLRHLTHLSTGMATTGRERLILVAGLMGMGMNYGLSKMADSCPYSYRQLSWSVDWHIREETLLTSLATLDNFVLNLPFARLWGDGTSSSSDGMRIETVVKTPHAVRNARYFGFGKGVTFYSHTADIWMPFGKQQVISTNESEALHVIDALCHHESDLHIREHYTDTGGSTDHVFALTALLGFKFAPRISSSLDRNLYTYQPVGDQGPLNELIASPVRAKYIIEHWEEMQRVASSIRHGSVSASLLMRRLRAYSRQNRLASALTELGKLERTSFLLDYFQDESLRRRILIGLNKGEALHALARQLFSGKHGELWDRAFEDQVHRASCLHLIMAAIATWNAVYLSQAVEELKKRGEAIPEEYLPHITPLGWEHINLIGQYSFTHQSARSLDNLRPLRLPEQEEERVTGERAQVLPSETA